MLALLYFSSDFPAAMTWNLFYQFYACFCANCAGIIYGITIGWASPSIPLLQSDTSPLLSGPITEEEGSWINSIMCVGGLVGTIFFGWMGDYFGRKWSLYLVALPQIASYLLILIALDVEYLYVSRFLGGFGGGGVFVLVPLFVTEIAEDSIRGTLGACLILIVNFGILVGLAICGYLDFFVAPLIPITILIVFLILFQFLPETPQYLLMRKRKTEAEVSFRFYRGYRKATDEMPDKYLREFANLQKIYDFSSLNTEDQKVSSKDFATKSTRIAIIISFTLIVLACFCGTFTLINYAADIFHDAGSSFSPNIAAIIVGGIQVVGSCGSYVLVDRAGRRILLMGSALATGIFHTVMGVYVLLVAKGHNLEGFEWVPVVSLSGVMLVSAVGVVALPYPIMAELLPTKLRGIVVSMGASISWTISFLLVKYFGYCIQLLGLHGCIFFFAACCFFEVLFVAIVLPETKGKNYEEIVDLLSK
ncbi:facilitated trehalose transporter Tret1-like [Lutzomyia longipalpis]|uniref:facilitated trehalose transporter Tret1-like n=1 Tax=Lutzomyia longipalpis TaxID=7200 RepID=UPI002484338A|nr:facilitated trehalose transporter Tret1-like [Lutzomyia longipalpis]